MLMQFKQVAASMTSLLNSVDKIEDIECIQIKAQITTDCSGIENGFIFHFSSKLFSSNCRLDIEQISLTQIICILTSKERGCWKCHKIMT